MTPEFIALRRDHGLHPSLEPRIGTFSLAQLVLAQPYQRIPLLIAPDVISIGTETDQEECALLMERYNLSNLALGGVLFYLDLALLTMSLILGSL